MNDDYYKMRIVTLKYIPYNEGARDVEVKVVRNCSNSGRGYLYFT